MYEESIDDKENRSIDAIWFSRVLNLESDKSPQSLNKLISIFKNSTPKNLLQKSDMTLEVSGLSES